MNTEREKQVNRVQNLSIFLLTLAAVVLLINLPLFGALSDTSVLELTRERLRREASAGEAVQANDSLSYALPVRIVYTNGFVRLGVGALTTLSDEFEHAGTFLGEALGSANGGHLISEIAFLNALWGEGLYFDFTTPLPVELLAELLGVTAPPEPADVRRLLLVSGEGDAVLFIQDGEGRSLRFGTAVSSAALRDFLASQSGNEVDFAGLLGIGFSGLSPYTLLFHNPLRYVLTASNALAGNEDEFLRRAEFNPHTENRFTESSGTVIVREVSSTLYLRPDGTVAYLGSDNPAPGSLYNVHAAEPGFPTMAEAASAAQALASSILQAASGEAALYLSESRQDNGIYEFQFDRMAGGAPIRYADGSHAASVTVEGRRITAFTIKARHYTLSEDSALLLPFTQAAAIAAGWNGAELVDAYVDNGAETLYPVWLAE